MTDEEVLTLAARVVRTCASRYGSVLHYYNLKWDEMLSVAVGGILEESSPNEGYKFVRGLTLCLAEVRKRRRWRREVCCEDFSRDEWDNDRSFDGEVVYDLLKGLTDEERDIVTARFGIGRKEEYLFDIGMRLGWSTRLVMKELDRILAKMLPGR